MSAAPKYPAKTIVPTGPSVGLFGGSFNPAHEGHLHLAETARRSLGLDQIWWLVSPQNPLKPTQPSYDSRVASVAAIGLPRGHCVAHLERDFGTQYTIDLLRTAKARYPTHRFVFLMGADNFAQLPHWRDWNAIMATLPIGVIARPTKSGGLHFRARLGQAARQYAHARISETAAQNIASMSAPKWAYITAPLNSASSTAIRKTLRSKT